MTKAEKEFCERCNLYGQCGFIPRGMERKCDLLSIFSEGYDAAVDKACDWWKEEFSYPTMTPEEHEWYNQKIEEFRKAMLEEE